MPDILTFPTGVKNMNIGKSVSQLTSHTQHGVNAPSVYYSVHMPIFDRLNIKCTSPFTRIIRLNNHLPRESVSWWYFFKSN